ncbi:MAG TPA: hypothetical protein VFP65_15535 [Anaeromyxobacteraceae bacterium]|nr:hypothetical protein [Anaeromyxobacteraceae bacterium]
MARTSTTSGPRRGATCHARTVRSGAVGALCTLLAAGCASPERAPGRGAVRVTVPALAREVVRVVATVTGPGISAPIRAELAVAGEPRSAAGTLSVPAGAGRTLVLEGFPALPPDPGAAPGTYCGSATVDVARGETASVTATLLPVVGDVHVPPSFSPAPLALPELARLPGS